MSRSSCSGDSSEISHLTASMCFSQANLASNERNNENTSKRRKSELKVKNSALKKILAENDKKKKSQNKKPL